RAVRLECRACGADRPRGYLAGRLHNAGLCPSPYHPRPGASTSPLPFRNDGQLARRFLPLMRLTSRRRELCAVSRRCTASPAAKCLRESRQVAKADTERDGIQLECWIGQHRLHQLPEYRFPNRTERRTFRFQPALHASLAHRQASRHDGTFGTYTRCQERAGSLRQQGQGIGAALVRRGLDLLESLAEPIVIVRGDLRYYGRFGFEPSATVAIEPPFGVAGDHYLVKRLRTYDPSYRGVVRYPSTFTSVGYPVEWSENPDPGRDG